MPRIRTLKPEALQHRKVGRLTDRAFRLWIGLITQADDDGRLSFDVDQLRFLVWGYHRDVGPEVVAHALDELRALGLCRLYGAADSLYVDLPSWDDHQVINRKRKSKLPEFKPNMAYSGSTHGALTERSVNTHGVLTDHSRGIGRKEGRKDLEQHPVDTVDKSADRPAPPEPAEPGRISVSGDQNPAPDREREAPKVPKGKGPLSGLLSAELQRTWDAMQRAAPPED